MSLVDAPLAQTSREVLAHASPTVRAMEIGQHMIAGVLVLFGVWRAIGSGTPPAAAVITGLAIIAWHTAGTVLPSRTSSRRLIVWWLVGFALTWVAAVAVSAEFVWIAFLLWMLAGHLLPLGLGARILPRSLRDCGYRPNMASRHHHLRGRVGAIDRGCLRVRDLARLPPALA